MQGRCGRGVCFVLRSRLASRPMRVPFTMLAYVVERLVCSSRVSMVIMFWCWCVRRSVSGASSFNGDLSSWDTSSVRRMKRRMRRKLRRRKLCWRWGCDALEMLKRGDARGVHDAGLCR